jgi:16S rRNA (adenine1518-N6/adenine1519-N6)-dimethyltransferase
MKLSEMKHILSAGDIQLTRSLGQNFLHDANQLRRIVAAADLRPTDRVLEIGPGLGPLTEMLVQQAGTVLAIEKDARLVQVLQQRFRVEQGLRTGSLEPAAAGAPGGLQLLHADALDYLRREARDWSAWKLVANLPYSVASPILVELAQGGRGPERMVATLQIEVARRLMAGAGDADYGLLTLLIQLDYEPGGWFKIPASCFFPEPDVDSACVTLRRRAQPLLGGAEREAFTRIVKRSFSQRRKMMLKLLKADWPEECLLRAFQALGLSPQARAETLKLEQFAALTQFLLAKGPCREAPVSTEIFDVVNERDEVIGQRPREEVHRLGLMHRAVHLLVFNARGQVFLQKRSLKKDRQPGVWDSSSSGHVDAGEAYDTSVVREAREEVGLHLSATPERLFKLPPSAETDQEHVWVYRCVAEGPFTLHPEEIEEGGWFTPEQLTRWMAERPQDFATALLALWRRLDKPLD